MTLAELQTKREAVLKDIGIARVQMGDLSVEYLIDKKRTLEILDLEIAKAAGSGSRMFTIETKRGLEG